MADVRVLCILMKHHIHSIQTWISILTICSYNLIENVNNYIVAFTFRIVLETLHIHQGHI